MLDLAGVMAKAQKQGWALVALDVAVDTSTPTGEAMAHVLATFAQLERRLISQRTRDALAIKKAQGVQLGRPRSMPNEIRERIRRMHASGESLAGIARALTAEGVPTAQTGRRWYPSTVRAVLRSGRA
jgi:DNA invertase Pin-like site-specific DNA recombinase